MTRICPQCGNPNDDAIKFCTACGNALGLSAAEPGTAPVPATDAPAAGQGRKTPVTILVIVAAALLVILAALVFLQVSGTVKILPFPVPADTPRPTPVVTSFINVETPQLETTVPEPEAPLNMTNVTESPALPPTTRKAVVCPSDRRACGTECVDSMTDPMNCGGCNVSCGMRETCQEGHCAPFCGGTGTGCPDGFCHDLAYDAENCGSCGNTCPVGLVCNKSVCTPPLKTVIPTYMG